MPRRSHIVYFATETTTKSPDTGHDEAEIVHIYAAPQGKGKEFVQLIVPDGDFHPTSSQRDRFYKADGELIWADDDSVLDADSPEDGLDAFMDYLDYISEKNGDVSLVLVAHDCFAFDAKVLCNQIFYHNTVVSTDIIEGFSDSLKIARSLYKECPGYFTLNRLDRRLSSKRDAKEKARGTRNIVRAMAKRNDMSVEDCVDRVKQKDYETVYEAAEERMQEFIDECGQYS